MSIAVKGEQIKLLDTSMIRRYNSPTPFVDPAVAKILVDKGFAVYLNKKVEKLVEVEVEVETKVEEEVIELFPKEIIKE